MEIEWRRSPDRAKPDERIRLAPVEQSGAPAPGDRDLEPADIARLTSIFCGGMTNEISIEVDGKHDTGMK
jgi:hypothetical protein